MELKPSETCDYHVSQICQTILAKQRLNDIDVIYEQFKIPKDASIISQHVIVSRIITDQSFLVHMHHLTRTSTGQGIVELLHFGAAHGRTVTDTSKTKKISVFEFSGEIPLRAFLRVFSSVRPKVVYCSLKMTVKYKESGVDKTAARNIQYGKEILDKLVPLPQPTSSTPTQQPPNGTVELSRSTALPTPITLPSSSTPSIPTKEEQPASKKEDKKEEQPASKKEDKKEEQPASKKEDKKEEQPASKKEDKKEDKKDEQPLDAPRSSVSGSTDIDMLIASGLD